MKKPDLELLTCWCGFAIQGCPVEVMPPLVAASQAILDVSIRGKILFSFKNSLNGSFIVECTPLVFLGNNKKVSI
ncbi:MAG: hypothetical protein PVF83_12405 [Anaerolineales bacterium]|jgi:hypothetical protein